MIPMRLLPTLLPAALLAACSNSPSDPSTANFEQAMNTYLAARGDLCINRGAWPVDITREEAQQGSRNTVQMPVLEKLGLVQSSIVADTQARRYELTDAGRQYYLPRAPHQRDAGHAVADHDFCAAHLTLKRVVRWEPPSSAAVGAHTVVSYTYDVSPAPWTADAEARRAFPMVDRVLRGAGVVQLQEPMVLTPRGWEAQDL